MSVKKKPTEEELKDLVKKLQGVLKAKLEECGFGDADVVLKPKSAPPKEKKEEIPPHIKAEMDEKGHQICLKLADSGQYVTGNLDAEFADRLRDAVIGHVMLGATNQHRITAINHLCDTVRSYILAAAELRSSGDYGHAECCMEGIQYSLVGIAAVRSADGNCKTKADEVDPLGAALAPFVSSKVTVH